MAELDLISDERPGIMKEIDEGAYDLIFQAIQEDMYTYPMRSFIRESVSNGLDAIVERDIYKAIESGQPVDKYYLQRNDGKLLKDSGFDAEYYNSKFLSNNPKVMVSYREGTPRDLVTIRDNGVGLGGSRLRGFFKLGYSSKRNMKHVIGKFGAGAKAGLATGVEYFSMTTTYNGFKTSFMIYKHDYDNITPEHENGKEEVWEVKMSNGRTEKKHIYWTPTTEPNGVEISLEVKKHNKKLCIDSVKSQFQYFNGRVHLTHRKDNGESIVDPLNKTPLYESSNLLIPKYSTYNSPHILVDGISYGIVSWDELELERRTGRIAIKVHATDVDITQSRESLKWTEKTKQTILKAVEKTKDEASDYITRQLSVNDGNIFQLTRMYSNVHKSAEDSVSAAFKKFLDLSYIKAKFKLGEPFNVDARMGYRLFDFLFYSFNIRRVSTYNQGGKTKIRTERIESFSGLGSGKIVYAEGASLGPRLAVHLLNKYESGHFIYIRKSTTRIKAILELYDKEYSRDEVYEYSRNMIATHCDLNLDTYDVVYDESEDDLESEVSSSSEKEPVVKGLAALERKANKEVLYMQYYNQEFNLKNSYEKFTYRRNKYTVKISEIENDFDELGNEIVLVPGKFTELGRLMELTHYLTYGIFPTNFVYVSQEVIKNFLPHGILITDYFRKLNTETGELMIGGLIRDLNTLRIFRRIVEEHRDFGMKFNVIEALTSINMHQYKELMHNSGTDDLRDLIEERGNIGAHAVDTVFAYLEVLEKFHNTVKTGDKDLISQQALELFGSGEIFYLDAYDEEFISTVEDEFKRLEPIHPILDIIYDMDLTHQKELLELLLKTKNNLRDDNIS